MEMKVRRLKDMIQIKLEGDEAKEEWRTEVLFNESNPARCLLLTSKTLAKFTYRRTNKGEKSCCVEIP
jgi:hypothetical protein